MGPPGPASVPLPSATDRASSTLRRLLDIIFATALLLIVAPLIAVLVIVLYVRRPGRVLTAVSVRGPTGKVFDAYRLNTAQATSLEPTSPSVTTDNWIRHSGLDRLPELWNVLAGDMTLFRTSGPGPNRVDQPSTNARSRSA